MAKDIEASATRTASLEVMEGKSFAAEDVDEALKFLNSDHGTANFEEVDEKALLRKIDWMLMPLMFLCYFLQYSDKTLST